MTTKKYKAGAYLRLSIEDEKKQNESVSIKNQRTFIRDYALKNNIEIHDYYIDDGYSGGDFDRPNFKRMIIDIEQGIINCVITKDMSRLGRDFIDTGNYVFKYFPDHNVRYISILENYDTLVPNGVEDILPFKAVINDMYLKDISNKIKSVRHNMMQNGEFVASTVPYGFKRSKENSKLLIIDDYAASIVKRIFEMKNSGISDGMIARQLTINGILPPDVYRGKKLKKDTISTNIWKPGTVKAILKNEAYIGNLIQGKYERVSLKSKKKRLLPKNKWIIKKGALPQIISVELFDKVNTRKEMDIRYRIYDYLLKGLVTCGDCGVTMSVRRVKNKRYSNIFYAIYICRTYSKYRNKICSMHYYREEILNNLVLKQIRNVLCNYANNEQLERKYDAILYDGDALRKYERILKSYRAKIITIDKAISDLYKDRANNTLSNDEFLEIKKELEKNRKECSAKIIDTEALINESKNILTDKKIKIKYINNFLKLNSPTKQLIKILVNKIEILENKSVKLYFNFSINRENNEN